MNCVYHCQRFHLVILQPQHHRVKAVIVRRGTGEGKEYYCPCKSLYLADFILPSLCCLSSAVCFHIGLLGEGGKLRFVFTLNLCPTCVRTSRICDITTSLEANHGPVCDSHRCDVATRSFLHACAEIFFREVQDILHRAVRHICIFIE